MRPRIGTKPIYDLRRRDIVEMLDAIEDEHGPVMADRTLARVRKAFNWHSTRDDAFVPPIVRGMARTSIAERARERVLSDDELRAVWRAADTLGTAYARMLQFILLTATRLREASNMNRGEISTVATRVDHPGGPAQVEARFSVPAVASRPRRPRQAAGQGPQGLGLHHRRRHADLGVLEVEARIR